MPERTVVDIRPLGAADGSEGYEVESVRSGAWLRKERRVQRPAAWSWRPARWERTSCCSAVAWRGSLPRLSTAWASSSRTNSESILAVTVPEDYHDDLINAVAITSSIYPDPDTHIETVTYGHGGDSMRIATRC